MPEITLDSAGITTNAQIMDNGERRFRFMMADDSAYIRTEAGADGAWQNAHFHKGVRETYIVQAGWMAFATMSEVGDYSLHVYKAGDVISSQPGEHHNVYLPSSAVIHTVKHGEAIGNPEKGGADWYEADEKFDAWTKGISEEYMAELSDAYNGLVGWSVEIGDECLEIAAIGNPNPRWLNQPSSCPVRFNDGSFGVVWDWTQGLSLILSNRDDFNQAIRESSTMPQVGAIGSDVMNIYVTDKDGCQGRLRTFYNEKADISDSIGWKDLEDA